MSRYLCTARGKTAVTRVVATFHWRQEEATGSFGGVGGGGNVAVATSAAAGFHDQHQNDADERRRGATLTLSSPCTCVGVKRGSWDLSNMQRICLSL